MVGYGPTANAFETGPTGVTANATALIRQNGGCTDGSNNSLDFVIATPTPRNSQTMPVLPCACTANETAANPLEMDFCNLQFPASTTTTVNVASADIFARVFEDTFTQAGGANAAIKVQIGYGPPTVNPSFNQGGYVWTDAVFNVQVGNDDEYKAKLTVPAAGSYRYTSRVTRDNRNWTYCDLGGAGANAGLQFDLPQLGALTVN